MIRLKQKFDPSTYVSYAYTASLFAPFSLPLPGASADSTYPDSLAYLAYLKLPSFSVDLYYLSREQGHTVNHEFFMIL